MNFQFKIIFNKIKKKLKAKLLMKTKMIIIFNFIFIKASIIVFYTQYFNNKK